MAIRKNHGLKGPVGPVVFRSYRGQELVQSMPENVHQTEATEKAADLFGKASGISRKVRTMLSYCYREWDGEMVNRFTVAHRAILDDCLDRETNTFYFGPDSFRRLVGLEFNINSLLINNLLVQLHVRIEGNQLIVIIPAIQVPAQLKFPLGATHCMPILGIAFYVPENGRTWARGYKTAEIENARGVVPAQEFIYNIPEGTLCLVGLGLTYYKIEEDFKIPLNSKAFDPAGICGAVVNPGFFDLEDLGDEKKDWYPDFDLVLGEVLFHDGSFEVVKKKSKADHREGFAPVDYVPPVKNGKLKNQKITSEKVEPAITKAPESNVPDVARNLKAMGFAIEDIIKATGLSANDIENL